MVLIIMPPQAQEDQATAEPSTQPPVSHIGVKRQHNLGHC